MPAAQRSEHYFWIVIVHFLLEERLAFANVEVYVCEVAAVCKNVKSDSRRKLWAGMISGIVQECVFFNWDMQMDGWMERERERENVQTMVRMDRGHLTGAASSGAIAGNLSFRPLSLINIVRNCHCWVRKSCWWNMKALRTTENAKDRIYWYLCQGSNFLVFDRSSCTCMLARQQKILSVDFSNKLQIPRDNRMWSSVPCFVCAHSEKFRFCACFDRWLSFRFPTQPDNQFFCMVTAGTEVTLQQWVI